MHNSFHMQDSTPKFVYCNKKKEVFISSKLKSFGLKVFFAKVLNYSYLFIFCVKDQVFVIAESQALLFDKNMKLVLYIYLVLFLSNSTFIISTVHKILWSSQNIWIVKEWIIED